MKEKALLTHLFRTEYRNIVSVLCYLFGIQHIEVAEDIVSDTFLTATELWDTQGTPDNPTGWLYTVAKNKTRNYLKRNSIFDLKLSPEIKYTATQSEEMEIDLSEKNISDSQLAMIFTICDEGISRESQIALALNLLCGFGIQEIADSFLSNKEVIYKRINRAREKLKAGNMKIEQPTLPQIAERLPTVLTTLYLLFSEGYYSTSQHSVLRKDLCVEAMRLVYLLLENDLTNKPSVNALYSLMCFHASRFDARAGEQGRTILYHDQNEELWNKELIKQGQYFLNKASTGNEISKYHLEAGIAYWHTHKQDSSEKWESILELYNELLILEYSPVAALNRSFAISKARGKADAINEALKLKLTNHYLYFSLLGYLYTDIDHVKALENFQQAHDMAITDTDKAIISDHINKLL